MIHLVLFALMNLAVFGAGWWVVPVVLRRFDPVQRTFCAVLLSWCYIVVGIELLALCAAVHLFGCAALAGVAAAIGLAAVWKSRSESTDLRLAPPRFQGSAACLIGLAAAVAVDALIVGLRQPVQPVSDAPIYHLYFAIRWWKEHTVSIVPTPFGESAAPYFPSNGDVWLCWLAITGQSELFAKVGQWPFLVCGVLGLYGIARELGVTGVAGLIPGVLWGTGTLQVTHAGWADVDLIMAAFMFGSAWFLICFLKRPNISYLVASGLSCGAALGTKYVAIPLLAPVVLGVIVAGFKRRSWTGLTTSLVTILLPCGFWYARNCALSGNPLYPLQVEFADWVLFPGWYTRADLLSSGYHIPVGDYSRLLVLLVRLLDPVLIPIWVAGWVGAVWAWRRGDPCHCALAALGLWQILVFWWVNPYQTQDRFLFPAAGFLAIQLAWLLQRAGWLGWLVLVGTLCHLTIGQVVSWFLLDEFLGIPLPQITPGPLPAVYPVVRGLERLIIESVVLGSSEATVEIAKHGLVRLVMALGFAASMVAVARGARLGKYRWLIAALVIGSLVVIRFQSESVDPRTRGFYPEWPQGGFLPGWIALEDAVQGPALVAYAGTNLPYYLYGPELENRVRYVNIGPERNFALHDHHRSFGRPKSANSTPDWDRRVQSPSDWIANLQAHGVDFLFVGKTNVAGGSHNINQEDPFGFPIERAWADQRPDRFELIHGDSATRVYRFR